MTMPIIYNPKKNEYEKTGYIPFVCIIKWEPEERPAVIKKFSQVFDTPEGHGNKAYMGGA
jgi:hypothetical protein